MRGGVTLILSRGGDRGLMPVPVFVSGLAAGRLPRP